MTNTALEINAPIVVTGNAYAGLTGKIATISKGWYEVELDDGRVQKMRAKHLLVNVPAEEQDTDEDEELTDAQKMKATLERHRTGYEKTVAHSGSASLDNGDKVAKALRGLHPVEAMVLANMVVVPLDPEFDAFAKYGHLNNGQQRMNSGNKIRGAVKREETTNEEVLGLVEDACEKAAPLIAELNGQAE